MEKKSPGVFLGKNPWHLDGGFPLKEKTAGRQEEI